MLLLVFTTAYQNSQGSCFKRSVSLMKCFCFQVKSGNTGVSWQDAQQEIQVFINVSFMSAYLHYLCLHSENEMKRKMLLEQSFVKKMKVRIFHLLISRNLNK